MRQGDNQNILPLDPVDDSVGIAVQKLAAVATPDGFPKLGKRGDLFTRFAEFREKSCREGSGMLLVKGHRLKDFQLGLDEMMDGHRFRISDTLASNSALEEDRPCPDFQPATR